ncbi:MAG: CBS domain-containing protein [Candidatus Diapherotrites archaeon]|nr:CBS domain-containing protein [Candidatus Diapherotrites archaeon]
MNVKEILKKDFLAVFPTDTVSSFIGKLKSTHERGAIVVNDKAEYLGITSKKNMNKLTADFSKMNVESIMQKCPVLSEDDEVDKAIALMFTADTRILPVTNDKNRVIGAVYAKDLMQVFKTHESFKTLKAKDFCSRKLVSVNKDSNLGEAVKLMRINGVNRILVLGEERELVGVVSFRDILKKHLSIPPERQQSMYNSFEKEKIELSALPISTEMISEVKTCSPEEPLTKIAELVTGAGGSHVVLIEKNKPVGIITPKDLFKAYLNATQVSKRNLQFKDLPELDEIDKVIVERTVTEVYDKAESILDNEIQMKINVKTTKKGGKTHYTIKTHLSSPGVSFASEAEGWKFLTTLQDAAKTLEREVKNNTEKMHEKNKTKR